MAKPKSKIPTLRPASEKDSVRLMSKTDPSGLRRASSDLSKHINRTRENDENSVHSLDLNSSKLRVRKTTVTIKDNKGLFLKSKRSYKLSYDHAHTDITNGGASQDFNKSGILQEVSINDLPPDSQQVVVIDSNQHVDRITRNTSNDSLFNSKQALSEPTFKESDTFILDDEALTTHENEADNSRTIFTEDTSIPVFDDNSSVTVLHTGNTYILDNQASENRQPSRSTVRLLTPQDRNEPNMLFTTVTNKKVPKAVHPETNILNMNKGNVAIGLSKDETMKSTSKPVLKESTNGSLPPLNFKTNLFNRIQKVSTPVRTPALKPVQPTKPNDDKLIDEKKKLHNLEQRNIKPKPNHVEDVFVKDSSLKRFERLNSSESVRSHYDKKLKRESDETKSKAERYELVNLDKDNFEIKPKRHKRNTELAVQQKSDNHSNLFSKQDKNGAIPIKINTSSQQSNVFPQKPVLGTSTRQASVIPQKPLLGTLTQQASVIPQKPVLGKSLQAKLNNTQGPQLLLTEKRAIENTDNDIFTEDDRKARLKQAQYITDDLKIVKTKLQDSDFVAQHIDKQIMQLIQKKSVLNNFNKNKALQIEVPDKSNKQIDSQLNETPIQTKSMIPTKQPQSLPQNKIDSNKVPEIKTAHLNVQPNNALVQAGKHHKQNIWRVQPKIHRFNPNRTKPIDRDFQNLTITDDSFKTSSIATWVLNSAQVNIRKERALNALQAHKLFHKKKPRTSGRRRSRQTILKRSAANRKQSRGTLSQTTASENLINEGMYLPIGRKKLKRKPKRLRRKLFTKVGKKKGYESEIPVLYSDDTDVYPEPRPLTDTERGRYPHYRRYEEEYDNLRINYRDPAHRKIGRATGALVRFFRNGDADHKGVPLTVNRNFRNLETLLVYLNDKIPTPTGVKYIFKWPEGSEITSVTEFKNRCVYIVSSTRSLRRDVNYGDSRESFWSNKKPSAGPVRKDEVALFKRPISPKESPVRSAPIVVTIVNNLVRDKTEKVILNPNTPQSFESWLEDIANHDMPVRTIFSDKKPYTEIKSFSQLFREIRMTNRFIACGEELVPVEMMPNKRQAPSSNSSTDSVTESRGRKKKLPKQQDMGQIYENGRQSPTSTAMSRYDNGPRLFPPGMRMRPMDNRRNVKDVVEIEVDGVMREFYPPSYQDPEDDGGKPDKILKCDWVYGFRGRDARHNLIVLPKTGELVYFVAAVVVLYDKEKDSQRHYTKHNEEITCMALHPNQYMIATGQMHGKEHENSSHIRIWHGVNLSTYSVIGLGVFYGGILSVGFSQDGAGNYMCALDGSEKHVLSVWDWQTEKVIARTTTTTDPVHCACFYPDGSNNSLLVTYGARHIYFWKIFYDVARKKEAKILRDRNSGIFEDDVPKSINCLVFLSTGDVVTGDTSGNLMNWDRDASDAFTCKFIIKAHEGSILSMCVLEDGTLLSASGNEIKAWDSNANFRAMKTRQIPKEAGTIRSLMTQVPGGMDGKLYIGTTNSAILDGSLQLKFRYLVQGHSDGVWGVVPHPFEPTFVSAGFDQVVYKWSLITHKVIWRSQVEAPCTAVAVDHRHELIAIGTSEGTFIVLNAYNGMHIATVQVGTEPIGCLAFSPDGMLLAMGCNDGLISIYAIHDRGQTYRKFNMALREHSSGVAHLDWSKDGRCIQSTSFDNELIFWDIDSMQQIKLNRMMRDVEWFTNTCHVAYNLIGPWSNLEKGEVLKVVNRSPYRDLYITGDSKGRIRLYKSPCSKEKAEFRGVRIYSSDVTAVAFTPDGRSVLTCGGNDAALVQWGLIDE